MSKLTLSAHTLFSPSCSWDGSIPSLKPVGKQECLSCSRTDYSFVLHVQFPLDPDWSSLSTTVRLPLNCLISLFLIRTIGNFYLLGGSNPAHALLKRYSPYPRIPSLTHGFPVLGHVKLPLVLSVFRPAPLLVLQALLLRALS